MPRNSRPRGLAITDRDVSVLSFLGDLGLIDSRQVHARFWNDASLRPCQDRMQRYETHGLVRSLELTVARYRDGAGNRRGGRLPLLYTLTPEGAALVERETGEKPKRCVNSELKAMTALHRRDIVRVRLYWDDSCSVHGVESPLWIHEEDTRTDVPRDAPPVRRRVLFHEFTVGERRVTCQPDLFSMTAFPRPQRPAAGDAVISYYEIDRGTMSHADLKRKLAGYAALVRHRAWRRYVPNSEQSKILVRVLWITQTCERARNIRESFGTREYARIFRYTSLERLARHDILADPIWTDPAGKDRCFLPQR